jgi:hypothetical protein
VGNQDQNGSVVIGKSSGSSGSHAGWNWVWVLATLLIAGGIFFLVTRPDKNANQAANQVDSKAIKEALADSGLSLDKVSGLGLNRMLRVNKTLVVTPGLQPTGAQSGQIYYDQGTNQLAYYNGTNFVFLTGPSEGVVQSIGGASGPLSIGTGLSVDQAQLSNSGVISVQGKNGAVTFTAGAGIVINGTNFRNSGVLSVKAGTPNVTVADDGSGGVTISVSGGGSGTLAVSDGGTGATSLTADGVLVGNGTSAITSVAAGGAGLCLLSTVGAPAWGACSGGSSGVTSLNGLTGVLSLANASGAGSTVTIDNASTSAKGIASFNSSNFSVTSGAVNTIQNIGTGASPTFAAVNTNTITPSGAMTVGATGQSLTLQGSAASTITATSGGNTTTISFTTPTAARAVVIPNESGTICLQASTNCGFLATGDTNVAKLNATQTFTGVNTFQNTVNSSNAFRVLTAGGSSLVNVDTTEGELELGQGSTLTGTLLFRNAANGFIVTLSPSVQSAHRAILLPDEDGTLCMRNSTNCGFAAASGSGNYINNTSTVQTNANIAIQSAADAAITLFVKNRAAQSADLIKVVDSSNNMMFRLSTFGSTQFAGFAEFQSYAAFGIVGGASSGATLRVYTAQDASKGIVISGNGGQTADLLQLDSRNVTGVLTVSATGKLVSKNTADSTSSFEIQKADATPLLTVDTTNSKLIIAKLDVSGTLTVNGHIISGGSAPSIAAGPAACTTPTVNVSGTDTAGLITVTAGTACGSGGKLAAVTFNSAFGAAPRVVLTAANDNAAGLHYYADNNTISTTAFDLTTQTADTIVNATVYRWYYHVMQ